MAQKIGGRLRQRYDELAGLGEISLKPFDKPALAAGHSGARGETLKLLVNRVQARFGHLLSGRESFCDLRHPQAEKQCGTVGLLRLASLAPPRKGNSSLDGIDEAGFVKP